MQPSIDGSGVPAALLDAKKKSLIASERETPRIAELRERFIERAQFLSPEKLVFLDEAGSNIAMTPDHAWAPRGQRVHDVVPRNRGTVTTMLGALRLTGLVAMMTVEGATDAEVFNVFVEKILLPVLHPGDVVVVDNVGAHRVPQVRARIEAVGARLIFLPPYSPDLNPIEECWSKLKRLLKRSAARSRDELDIAIAEGMELITPSDAAGWFRHAGYLGQVN